MTEEKIYTSENTNVNTKKSFKEKLILVLRMVKIEHSVFALPFAYLGQFLAAKGWPGIVPFILLTLAMVAIRSFAMAMNRILDIDIDRANPRTQTRPLVTGELSMTFAISFAIVMAILFIFFCFLMNSFAFIFSVPALILSAFYSLTKRFTVFSHFVLGAVLGLAPVAGYVSVVPEIPLVSVLFFFGVTFWVAGFDIIYSCQDAEFDKNAKLYSIPSKFGLKSALFTSSFSHILTIVFFALAGYTANLGMFYYIALGLVAISFLIQHKMVTPDDLSKVKVAFFTFNGFVSILLFIGAIFAL